MASALQVWGKLLGLNKVVVEGVEFLEDQRTLVVAVRVARRAQGRCSECGRRCPGYDQGYGRRQWRGLDLGTTLLQLEADTPRVKCPEHGVISASVPWARRGSRFTREFEDQCSWLAVNTSRSSVAYLLRVAWRTVGRIVERVMSEARKATDLLAGLRRIGIDELSYRKGHKYATVVVDHDTGRLVWMAPGRNKETVDRFFDELGPSRCASLELVSADGATWIDDVVQKRAPQAERCLDPFHVVQWATKALDDVRRGVWNDLRHGDAPGQAKDLKGARWALWKNPENLSNRQRRTLAWIAKVNAPLYRAYLLKEALRSVFHERTLPRAMARLVLRGALHVALGCTMIDSMCLFGSVPVCLPACAPMSGRRTAGMKKAGSRVRGGSRPGILRDSGEGQHLLRHVRDWEHPAGTADADYR